MNQIVQKLFLISHKMTYMGLLLLKLQAVELERRTEDRLLIANWHCTLSKVWFSIPWTVYNANFTQYLRQMASSQVTLLWCFNVIFEISIHLFLVFLLLTLNMLFFWLSTLWAKLHSCNLLSYRNETPPETSLALFSKAN